MADRVFVGLVGVPPQLMQDAVVADGQAVKAVVSALMEAKKAGEVLCGRSVRVKVDPIARSAFEPGPGVPPELAPGWGAIRAEVRFDE